MNYQEVISSEFLVRDEQEKSDDPEVNLLVERMRGDLLWLEEHYEMFGWNAAWWLRLATLEESPLIFNKRVLSKVDKLEGADNDDSTHFSRLVKQWELGRKTPVKYEHRDVHAEFSAEVWRKSLQYCHEINPVLSRVFNGIKAVPAGSVAWGECVYRSYGRWEIHDIDLLVFKDQPLEPFNILGLFRLSEDEVFTDYLRPLVGRDLNPFFTSEGIDWKKDPLVEICDGVGAFPLEFKAS